MYYTRTVVGRYINGYIGVSFIYIVWGFGLVLLYDILDRDLYHSFSDVQTNEPYLDDDTLHQI